MIFSWGWIGFPEQLTKLGKSLLSRLPVYYKGCNSAKVGWKRCRGQGTGEECGAPRLALGATLPAPSPLYQARSSLNLAL